MSSFLFSKYSDDKLLIAMTTRFGGVSSGVYSSLNMGINTNDLESNIVKNYDIVKSELMIDKMVKLNQVHGDLVYEVNAGNYLDIDRKEGDGLFTDETDIALTVLTADCFPVVLIGSSCISVLHCGWRSLNSSIIENAIKLFSEKNDTVKSAFVGVGIGEDNYIVKDDMVSKLDKRYNPEDCLSVVNSSDYKLDLRKLLINALKLNCVKEIDMLNADSSDDRFFSYRRDNGVTGRMATIVMKRK